jgi:hypothetical protein
MGALASLLKQMLLNQRHRLGPSAASSLRGLRRRSDGKGKDTEDQLHKLARRYPSRAAIRHLAPGCAWIHLLLQPRLYRTGEVAEC